MAASVLVVEDENIVALDIQRQLKRLGYQVYRPRSKAEEAVRSAGEEKPDVVLMDIQLRDGTDGIEAGRRILEMGIPVIMLTAYSDEKTLGRVRDIAPYGYIVKPYNERVLRTTVETAIHRHTMEKAVQQRQYLFEATLNSISEGVVVTGRDQQLRYMNHAARKLFSVGGKGEGEAAVPPGEGRFPGDYGEIRERDGEVFVLTKEGTSVPVEMNRSQLQENREQGEVWALRDVSEQRAMEQELRQSHKMEALGRFAGGIAHDFNNILTVILGYGTLLAEELAGQEGRAASQLEGIRSAARKARDLTQHLLVFSRQQVLERQEIALGGVITGWKDMLNRLIGSDIRIQYHLSVSSGDDGVSGDMRQIEQMLINLAANARDAMPEGGIVDVGLERVDIREPRTVNTGVLSPGSYVGLSIRDEGVGMDRETVSRAFDPFFTTKGEMSGTGLGLATAYGIVRQMGGEIAIQSQPGEGSLFTVYIPRVEAAEGAPGRALEETEGKEANPPDAGGRDGELRGAGWLEASPGEPVFQDRRFWVVQGDTGTGDLIQALLESRGGQVCQLENAGEAVLLADGAGRRGGEAEAAPDLIIADLAMPRIDGRIFLDRLRSGSLGTGVKGLLITEYSPRQLQSRDLNPGGYPLLSKPFEGAEFLNEVEKALADD